MQGQEKTWPIDIEYGGKVYPVEWTHTRPPNDAELKQLVSEVEKAHKARQRPARRKSGAILEGAALGVGAGKDAFRAQTDRILQDDDTFSESQHYRILRERALRGDKSVRSAPKNVEGEAASLAAAAMQMQEGGKAVSEGIHKGEAELSAIASEAIGTAVLGKEEAPPGWLRKDLAAAEMKARQGEAVNFLTYFLPGYGQAKLGMAAIGLPGQIAEHGAGAVGKSFAQSLNPFEEGLPPEQRVFRSVNLLLGIGAVLHAKGKLTDANIQRTLKRDFKLTDEQASGILDAVREGFKREAYAQGKAKGAYISVSDFLRSARVNDAARVMGDYIERFGFGKKRPKGDLIEPGRPAGEVPTYKGDPSPAPTGTQALERYTMGTPADPLGLKDAPIPPKPKPATPMPSAPSTPTKRTGVTVGRSVAISPADDSAYPVELRIVSLKDLIASHDTKGNPNPEYPGEGAQMRDRSLPGEVAEVERKAKELSPTRLLTDFRSTDRGAPLIGTDYVVESGNGRTLSIRIAQERYPQNYRAYYKELAKQFPEGALQAVSLGIEDPVLVQVRLGPIDARIRKKVGMEANRPSSSEMTAVEKARQDVGALPEGFERRFRMVGKTLEDALESATNRQLATEFVRSLPASEQAAMIDSDGRVSEPARERMARAIMFKVLGEKSMRILYSAYQDADFSARVFGGVQQAAGGLATLAEEVSGGNEVARDLRDTLVTALEYVDRAKSHKGGMARWFEQGALEDRNESAMRIGKALVEAKSKEQVSDVLGRVLSAATDTSGGMFGEELAFNNVESIVNAVLGDRAIGASVGEVPKTEKALDYNTQPTIRSPWKPGLEKVYVHHKRQRRNEPQHKALDAAKAGDIDAALEIVNDMLSEETLQSMKNALQGRRPIVVAVHALDPTGRNATPQVFATILAEHLDLPLDADIVITNYPGKTGKDAIYRLRSRATFGGPVEKGADYLLVDDYLTLGGTLADLRGYIETHGGNVIMATALNASPGSERWASTPEQHERLRVKLPGIDKAWKESRGYGIEELTHAEANFILRRPDSAARITAAQQARNRLAQAQQTRDSRQDVAKADEAPGRLTTLKSARRGPLSDSHVALIERGVRDRKDLDTPDAIADEVIGTVIDNAVYWGYPVNELQLPDMEFIVDATPQLQSVMEELGVDWRDTALDPDAKPRPREKPVVEPDAKQLKLLESKMKEPATDSKAQAAKASLSGRIVPEPLPGGFAGQLTDVIASIEKITDRKVLERRRRVKGASGAYFPESSQVTTRKANDIDTAAHEQAHALDDLYGIVADWAFSAGQSPFDAELQWFWGRGGSGGVNKPLVYNRAEGVAEFIRALIVNPKAAIRQAPTFYQHYENKVPAEVRKRLEEASDIVRRWFGASDLEKARAAIRTEKPKEGGIFRKADKSKAFKTSDLDRARMVSHDVLAPVVSAFREALHRRGIDPKTVRPSNDPVTLARGLAYFNLKYDAILEHGMTTPDGRVVTPPAKYLTRSLDLSSREATAKDLQDLEVLLVSERVDEQANLAEHEAMQAIVLEDLKWQEWLKEKGKQLEEHIRKEKAAWKAEKLGNARGKAQLERALAERKLEGKARQDELARIDRHLKRREARIDLMFESVVARMLLTAMARLKKRVDRRIDRFTKRTERRLQAKLEGLTGAGGGFKNSTGVHRRAIVQLQQEPERFARLSLAAAGYRLWADAVLQYMVAKGRISMKSYTKIKARNRQYAAMQRWIEDGDNISLQSGSALASAKDTIKRFIGSTLTIDSPLANLLQNTFAMLKEADRNEVLAALTKALRISRGIYQGEAIELASIGQRVDAGTKDAIRVYRKGAEEHWLFEEGVTESLKRMTDVYMPSIIGKIFSVPAKTLRWGVTRFPAFQVRNRIRDTLDTYVKSPHDIGLLDWLTVPNAEDKRLYAYFGGGIGRGMFTDDAKDFYQVRDRLIEEMRKHRRTIVFDFKKPFSAYRELTASSERSPRLAEIRAARRAAAKRFKSKYDQELYAHQAARDLIDFAQGGSISKFVSRYFQPFFNASVQGLRSSAKLAADHPGKYLKRFLLTLALPSAAVYIWNLLQGSEEEYEELPGYQRDFFWNLKLGEDMWLAIPKPFEAGVASSFFDHAMQSLLDDDRAFDEYPVSLGTGLAPFNESVLVGSGAGLLEVKSNYDYFRDRPIIPPFEAEIDLSLRKGTVNASQLGQIMQNATGTDARHVDHFIRSYLGDAGNWLMRLSDTKRQDRLASSTRNLGLVTGLVRQSPALQSPSVQYVIKAARRVQLRENPLKPLIDDYYDAKDGKSRDRAAAELRKQARVLRELIERALADKPADEIAVIRGILGRPRKPKKIADPLAQFGKL